MLNEWQQATSQEPVVTLEQMDKLVTELAEARLEYEKRKLESTNAHNVVEELEHKVINALKANGKTKYEAEGVGLVYTVTKEVYTTPKNNESKEALFNYIKEKYGSDVLTSMMSINHQTLNSFANKETESGEVMSIPGLQEPTEATTLSFRRK